MKKKTVNIFGAAVVLMALMLSQVLPAGIEAATETVPLWGPYLTGVSEMGITVNWRTAGETAGSVEYAEEEFYTINSEYNNAESDSVRELHHIELKGLKPATTYHYRLLIGEDEFTTDHTFTTPGSESFTFIVYGDTREQIPYFTQLERHKLVADRIAEEENISFVIHTGDLVYDANDMEEWGRFFESTRMMLDGIPFFPVAGNHETGSSNYADFFGMPPWYSFDCGNAHFIMMDTNDGTDFKAETTWLTDDISTDADWKFAVFHHPPYSSDSQHRGGSTDIRERWEPIFIQNGVNAVFSSHVHVYERYYENGIHYAVLGNGGAPFYLLADEKIDGYRNSLEYTLGYARITVNGDEARMDIIKVADVSRETNEVEQVYAPNTIFESVDLGAEAPDVSSGSTNDSGFAIAPTELEITVDENGSGTGYVYVTSHFNGELIVGIEDMPFQVKPEIISVDDTDAEKKIELTIFGDSDPEEGDYAGKLTFLVKTEKNVSYGIKIDLAVTKTGQTESTGNGYIIGGIAGGIMAALIIGILVGRKYRGNTGGASSINSDSSGEGN